MDNGVFRSAVMSIRVKVSGKTDPEARILCFFGLNAHTNTSALWLNVNAILGSV